MFRIQQQLLPPKFQVLVAKPTRQAAADRAKRWREQQQHQQQQQHQHQSNATVSPFERNSIPLDRPLEVILSATVSNPSGNMAKADLDLLWCVTKHANPKKWTNRMVLAQRRTDVRTDVVRKKIKAGQHTLHSIVLMKPRPNTRAEYDSINSYLRNKDRFAVIEKGNGFSTLKDTFVMYDCPERMTLLATHGIQLSPQEAGFLVCMQLVE
jgi:hypothetical protein